MDSDAPEFSKRRRPMRRSISTARRAGAARSRCTSADRLEISEDEQALAAWDYADIRRADSPSGHAASELPDRAGAGAAGVRDAALAAELVSRCASMDENTPGRRGVAVIVGWSLAAAVSIVAVVLFGVPLAADRLAPLVPEAFERRLGDVADSQVKSIFGAKVCDNAAGQTGLRQARHRDSRMPPASIPRCSPACCRARFPTPSRCRAARSICSTDCWRRPTTPTRSRACWRMNSAISSIATTCAG